VQPRIIGTAVLFRLFFGVPLVIVAALAAVPFGDGLQT